MRIDNQGSIVIFFPDTDAELTWLTDNTQTEAWQWQGKGSLPSLVVDHRFAQDLAEGIKEAGITLTPVQVIKEDDYLRVVKSMTRKN
jgi:hypothetical protein